MRKRCHHFHDFLPLKFKIFVLDKKQFHLFKNISGRTRDTWRQGWADNTALGAIQIIRNTFLALF